MEIVSLQPLTSLCISWRQVDFLVVILLVARWSGLVARWLESILPSPSTVFSQSLLVNSLRWVSRRMGGKHHIFTQTLWLRGIMRPRDQARFHRVEGGIWAESSPNKMNSVFTCNLQSVPSQLYMWKWVAIDLTATAVRLCPNISRVRFMSLRLSSRYTG